MQAAADEGRPYPFAPVDIGGNPASIVATLDQHRPYWSPSCQALYDLAIAAAVAHVRKDALLRDAHQRLIDAWQAGELSMYGLDDETAQFERIDPVVADRYSEDELGEIEIRDDAMFKHPAGALGFSRRPMYQNLVIERRALIEWAGTPGGADTDADAEAVPSSDEGMESPSPEEASSTCPKTQSIRSRRRTRILSKCRRISNQRRGRPSSRPRTSFARRIAAVFPHGLPPGLHDKELSGRIDEWCKVQGLKTPSSKTIRRATGKK
jgi:hypothetical protein